MRRRIRFVTEHSEHPLARAIVTAAGDAGVTNGSVTDFAAIAGAGATGTIDGTQYTVASPSHVATLGIDITPLSNAIAQAERDGATAVVLADDRSALAMIAIEDTIRPNARSAIEQLRGYGIENVVMLTGDNQLAADTVATQVGIDHVEAQLKPADKARIINDLVERFGKVAMVGDGINDAPSLAAASIGIAMGTAGSDVAIEAADVALMADDLEKLATALRIGHVTRRLVRQNLALSFVILAVLIPGALTGVLALPAAVAIHELSELAVILNGMRARRA